MKGTVLRLLGIAALAAGVFVGLSAWLVESQERPARADGGRIVELPGGDLHVREDGPRDAPPMVLIHGWTASMRWWDGVVPALARDHRVVRVDLLGHGGSEKPDDGYGIEQQADRIAALLDRLGVRRAAVVGHSLGGAVATALAEQHPSLVARLAVIGTTVVIDDELPLDFRIAFSPVLGPAATRVTPDWRIRSEMAGSFSDGFDIPDEFVEDVRRATYHAIRLSLEKLDEYIDAASLDQRLARLRLPVLAVYGEDEWAVEEGDTERLRDTPGVDLRIVGGLGHGGVHVERPAEAVALIGGFARGEPR